MSKLPRDIRRKNRTPDRGSAPSPVQTQQAQARPAGTTPQAGFPKISLTGGPGPQSLQFAIDGKPVKAHGLEILAGVDRASVVVVTRHYVELDIRLDDAEMVAGGYIVVIRQALDENTPIVEMQEVARGEGLTIREAVMAALDHLPADPAEETH